MYQTGNTLPQKIRIEISTLLQNYLASSIDLNTQAKQAHWNVKGPDFIALHELFDDIAESSEKFVDLLAERIVQLGGIAEGTIRAVVKRTQIPDYPLNISSGHQHVKALTHSLATYGELVRDGINKTEEMGDKATADIFTEISRETDKFLWFVEAHLQSER